jgi:uncharacterized membrane protein
MNTENSKKFNGQKLGWFIFESVMAVLYLLFAAIFLFPSLFRVQLAEQFEGIRIALGVVLGIYGIFRIFRVIKKIS